MCAAHLKTCGDGSRARVGRRGRLEDNSISNGRRYRIGHISSAFVPKATPLGRISIEVEVQTTN